MIMNRMRIIEVNRYCWMKVVLVLFTFHFSPATATIAAIATTAAIAATETESAEKPVFCDVCARTDLISHGSGYARGGGVAS